MKELVEHFRSIQPTIDYNVFKALDNINMDCILGYKKNREYHSFLEDYDSKKQLVQNKCGDFSPKK